MRFWFVFFFFSSRRRHTRCSRDWSSDVCSSDLVAFHDWDFPAFAVANHGFLFESVAEVAQASADVEYSLAGCQTVECGCCGTGHDALTDAFHELMFKLKAVAVVDLN